jgi:hypothetical protein
MYFIRIGSKIEIETKTKVNTVELRQERKIIEGSMLHPMFFCQFSGIRFLMTEKTFL